MFFQLETIFRACLIFKRLSPVLTKTISLSDVGTWEFAGGGLLSFCDIFL